MVPLYSWKLLRSVGGISICAGNLVTTAFSAMQIRDGLNDALLRASAERAAQAILMTPLTAYDHEAEDRRLAFKVMTGAGVAVSKSLALQCYAHGNLLCPCHMMCVTVDNRLCTQTRACTCPPPRTCWNLLGHCHSVAQ